MKIDFNNIIPLIQALLNVCAVVFVLAAVGKVFGANWASFFRADAQALAIISVACSFMGART